MRSATGIGRRLTDRGGQAAVEWAGAILVVSLVIVAVVTLSPGIGAQVSRGVSCEVSKVFGGHASCGSPTSTRVRLAGTGSGTPSGAPGGPRVHAPRFETLRLGGGGPTAGGSGRVHTDGGGQGCEWNNPPSCGTCPLPGVGFGPCTKGKLKYNVRWCGQQARRNTAAYRANKGKCEKEAAWLSNMDGNTACDILALLAGKGVGADTKYYLELAEWSDPAVGWTSWVAGIFGGAVAKAFCH